MCVEALLLLFLACGIATCRLRKLHTQQAHCTAVDPADHGQPLVAIVRRAIARSENITPITKIECEFTSHVGFLL